MGKTVHPGAHVAFNVAFALVVVTLWVALALGGCTSDPQPASSATSLEQAFRSSHPGGALPPGLKRADDGGYWVGEARRGSGLERVLVPTWLPVAYGLAAPYVAVGDGSVLPNPQIWHRGYRVSFTDGEGLIILHVGAGRLPGAGTWDRLSRRWRGARLWRRASDGLVVIAARRRAVPVAVAVAGGSEATAHRVLAGLRAPP